MQQKIRFQIEGMTCQACASRIEKVLNKKDFVESAGVNFASEEAQVVFDDSKTSVADIAKIIEKTGYGAKEKTEDTLPQPEAEHHIGWRLWLLFTINVPFLIGMAGMMIGRHDWMIPPLWQFALASVVQLWLAIPFYKSAWASIKGGLANMDVLVTIGTVSIYLYSVYMLFFSPHAAHGMAHVYFEAGVMVIGFVSLGKFLEHRTKKSSLNSLGLLLKLTPTQVNVQRNGEWKQLPIDQVQIGDLIRANHGERIAADGIIESGSGWADESHLTGESNPEEKKAGGKVLAGALMTEGSVVYRATQLGSQTQLGDMMNALSEAQGSKAPIARVADKAAAVFVPAVVGIALLTFIVTWLIKGDWTVALMHAVAVLVIACPCALGLATPAAIMVGMDKAVKHGIWFKDAAAMEEAAHVDAVVLDKTGTLTEGRPQVAAVYCVPDSGFDEDDLYRIAAAVEQNATHPLARAIVSAAQTRSLEIPAAQNAQTVVGAGIAAEVEDVGLVKAGKAEFAELTLPEFSDGVWDIASIVAVSVDNKPIGAFALADALKADTAEAIGRLKKHNIDVYIMSGDNQGTVEYVAKQLGIAHAFGNMSPRDKAAEVQKLKAAGKTVAMVGDGINDAPALAAANVSFAMKGGADVAEHTASATLMQHSVNQLADALLVSQATLKNIKQNLFFAFFYNILGIPLAALGFLNPVIAGAAMAASSVSVLSNALRLKRVKID
ncbi:TPA: heavy metal translocating P-type ATPase [Neisseria meningitidis]|uniref:heavy metal translocating P-type ATPase n=1 Tax=Neisseria meningitidis TaxID=487 RepID=UPI0001E5ED78|nr:heavy metal translocating P-type ATPase [Neisseria meningitidis]EGC53201.1 copper-exporting ATPase [Neisseria meningitidis OX99.30304]KER39567.1 copper-translocating P-type ATPase [Neisseria meningitidis 992008]ADO31763.1 putative cation-transporting ATPase [Neisseria meningitidis alpha710]AKM93612.1 Copper-exporting P-type ATPase A [Neisseria meningitidis M0579]EQD05462.1 copper-translocating P-type ATPase [Neisseria meningitidis NM045]